MRTLIAVVTVAVVLWMPGTLCAQGEAGGPAERIQDLQLTDEQEAKIADILKEHGPRIREAARELVTVAKDEVDKVRGVLTPTQKTKLETLKEERQQRRSAGLAERLAHLEDLDLTDAEVARIAEIRKEFRPRIGKALEGLQGLLSAEQKKARAEGLKAGKKRREVLASLNLTDEQKGKVAAVGQEIGALVRQELEQIRGVLNEGQKEKIAELKGELRERVRDRMAHRIANLRDLNLTEEQKAQIADIRREYRPRVQEAGNRLREAVRQEVEMVIGVLKA
jgi:Spy/CpxP family protein refolding chaperone